jgi:hypothetical protein
MEEIELSEQCRLGNNRARKELYEQYAGRMLGASNALETKKRKIYRPDEENDASCEVGLSVQEPQLISTNT